MFNTIYLLSILTHIVYFLTFRVCLVKQQSSMAMFLTGMYLPLDIWMESRYMDGMFYSANNFNGNVSNWDVSSVINMVVQIPHS